MKNLTYILLLFFVVATPIFANDPIDEQPPIVVKKTSQPIHLDGILDEEAWFAGTPATDFWEYFPSDTVRATLQTAVFFHLRRSFSLHRC